MIFDL